MTIHAPQNIYDDPTFFAGYKSLRQNDTGLNGALEVPAVRQLMPDLRGCTVLDLGCGFGDFARYAREAGAASVTALDVSSKMIEEAKRLTKDPTINYLQCAIEDYIPQPERFEVVVSSMALHYIADYRSVLPRLFVGLRPGGRFVFSVEHPVCTASPVGWIANEGNQNQYWPTDQYEEEGPRRTKWFVDNVIKHHRTVASYVNSLLETGFVLNRLVEPAPAVAMLISRPDLTIHRRRPPILILACSRPS